MRKNNYILVAVYLVIVSNTMLSITLRVLIVKKSSLQLWRVAANILNKQSRTADKRWDLEVWRGTNSVSP